MSESLAIKNAQSNTTKQSQCISMQNSIRFWDKLGHLEKWLFFATEDSVKVRIQVVVSSFFIKRPLSFDRNQIHQL